MLTLPTGTEIVKTAGLWVNRTYQAFVTLQPDWCPFNLLGADVINKQKYKTGNVSDLPHIISLNML